MEVKLEVVDVVLGIVLLVAAWTCCLRSKTNCWSEASCWLSVLLFDETILANVAWFS